jgi:hypothetical protein
MQAACNSRLYDGDLNEIDAVIGAPVILAKYDSTCGTHARRFLVGRWVVVVGILIVGYKPHIHE